MTAMTDSFELTNPATAYEYVVRAMLEDDEEWEIFEEEFKIAVPLVKSERGDAEARMTKYAMRVTQEKTADKRIYYRDSFRVLFLNAKSETVFCVETEVEAIVYRAIHLKKAAFQYGGEKAE